MLFFDSFALIEIIKGNQNYKKYLKEIVVTTRLNLMEVYYSLLKESNEEKAGFYYNFYLPACVSISDDTIKTAMKLKSKNRRLSYIDCLGYVLAMEFGIRFLTGDKEFKDLENVEFVE